MMAVRKNLSSNSLEAINHHDDKSTTFVGVATKKGLNENKDIEISDLEKLNLMKINSLIKASEKDQNLRECLEMLIDYDGGLNDRVFFKKNTKSLSSKRQLPNHRILPDSSKSKVKIKNNNNNNYKSKNNQDYHNQQDKNSNNKKSQLSRKQQKEQNKNAPNQKGQAQINSMPYYKLTDKNNNSFKIGPAKQAPNSTSNTKNRTPTTIEQTITGIAFNYTKWAELHSECTYIDISQTITIVNNIAHRYGTVKFLKTNIPGIHTFYSKPQIYHREKEKTYSFRITGDLDFVSQIRKVIRERKDLINQMRLNARFNADQGSTVDHIPYLLREAILQSYSLFISLNNIINAKGANPDGQLLPHEITHLNFISKAINVKIEKRLVSINDGSVYIEKNMLDIHKLFKRQTDQFISQISIQGERNVRITVQSTELVTTSDLVAILNIYEQETQSPVSKHKVVIGKDPSQLIIEKDLCDFTSSAQEIYDLSLFEDGRHKDSVLTELAIKKIAIIKHIFSIHLPNFIKNIQEVERLQASKLQYKEKIPDRKSLPEEVHTIKIDSKEPTISISLQAEKT